MDESDEDQRLPHRYWLHVLDNYQRPACMKFASSDVFHAHNSLKLMCCPVSCRMTPNEAVSLDYLKKLGVIYWKVKGEEDPKLQAIREARGYSYKVDIALLSQWLTPLSAPRN